MHATRAIRGHRPREEESRCGSCFLSSQKPTLPVHQKLRLQSHFGFDKVPFCKNLWVSEMFDSRSQREAAESLGMWLGIRGLAMVT